MHGGRKSKKKKKNPRDEVDENKKIDDFEPLGIEMVPVKTERAKLEISH